jgi:hypothetical protein
MDTDERLLGFVETHWRLGRATHDPSARQPRVGTSGRILGDTDPTLSAETRLELGAVVNETRHRRFRLPNDPAHLSRLDVREDGTFDRGGHTLPEHSGV